MLLPQKTILGRFVSDIMDKKVDSRYYLSKEEIEHIKIDYIKKNIKIGDLSNLATIELPFISKRASSNAVNKRLFSSDRLSPQLYAQENKTHYNTVFTGNYVHRNKIRKLKTVEVARLMGFPDNYRLPSRENVANGNLVDSNPVTVLEAIIERMI
jgi:site-specific DNA-cytosine methylase